MPRDHAVETRPVTFMTPTRSMKPMTPVTPLAPTRPMARARVVVRTERRRWSFGLLLLSVFPRFIVLLASALVAVMVSSGLGPESRVLAFVVPSDPTVGAGSEWIYVSNLGNVHVRMLERTRVGPEEELYRWDLRVSGLRYDETLLLTADALGATRRELSGFGLLKQSFSFEDDPELILIADLDVGAEWTWEGEVRKGNQSREAKAWGKVLDRQKITVPAGEFEVFHIRLVREDGFGTRQDIDLWFNPLVGPIKAVGDLQWSGLIGFVQQLVGLRRLEVELIEYSINSIDNSIDGAGFEVHAGADSEADDAPPAVLAAGR